MHKGNELIAVNYILRVPLVVPGFSFFQILRPVRKLNPAPRPERSHLSKADVSTHGMVFRWIHAAQRFFERTECALKETFGPLRVTLVQTKRVFAEPGESSQQDFISRPERDILLFDTVIDVIDDLPDLILIGLLIKGGDAPLTECLEHQGCAVEVVFLKVFSILLQCLVGKR